MDTADSASANAFISDTDHLLHKGAVIRVLDARRVGEGRDSYVDYLVQVENHAVRRRYSEFDQLRAALFFLNPTCIIPPLPAKQGVVGRIPGAAVDEAEHIEKRRRGLETFMKRVARHPILSASRLFIRFLEIPSASEVFQELGPAFHASAGVFTAANIPGLSLLTALVPKTVRPDSRFLDIQNHSYKFGQQVAALDRNVYRFTRRQNELAADYAELGAAFQTFAQVEQPLAVPLARVGDAVDAVFLSTRFLVSESELILHDPLQEYEQYVFSIKDVLKSQETRLATSEAAMDALSSKRDALKSVESKLSGVPDPTPATTSSMFSSFGATLGGLFDSNPQKTLRDNQVKLSAAVEQLEKEADAANSDLVKTSEAVLREYEFFNHQKAHDLRKMLLEYSKAQIDYAKKNVIAWTQAEAAVTSSA